MNLFLDEYLFDIQIRKIPLYEYMVNYIATGRLWEE